MLVELSVMEQRYQAVLAVVQDGWRVVEVGMRGRARIDMGARPFPPRCRRSSASRASDHLSIRRMLDANPRPGEGRGVRGAATGMPSFPFALALRHVCHVVDCVDRVAREIQDA